jgi:glyoxylase-like metal-dependent hydrolase (beta-lactamase superfamily II)
MDPATSKLYFPMQSSVFSKKELEITEALHRKEPNQTLVDSVLPIDAAGRAQLVTNDFALDDQVWLEPTPGHTPDHVAIDLRSKSVDAVMSGDLMHSPIQLKHPEWRARPDYDVAQARETRRAILDRYCETETLICTAHFPLPSVGHIVRDGDTFDFRYEQGDW